MTRKQRQYTAQFKLETVMEVLKGEKPIAQICRERSVTDSLVYPQGGKRLARGNSGASTGDIRGKDQRQPEQRDARADSGVGALGWATNHGECALKKGQQLAGHTTAEKRAMIQRLSAESSIRELCEVFDCPRSTYYYQSVRRDDSRLLAAIERILMRQPWFGYRRVLAQLKREGIQVGETVVRRLLKVLAHSRAVGQVRVRTTDSNHAYTRYSNLMRGLTLKRPNQVWVADITYIRLGTKFMYLAVILDAYTRAIRGWALSRSLSQELTLTALPMALVKGKPFIFHSDQGSQYSAWLHTEMLYEVGVRISMSDRGKPMQNGIAERLMRTLKEEHVDFADYADFPDAVRQIAHWLEVQYNTQRIHSALDYATPAEFETAAFSSMSPSF